MNGKEIMQYDVLWDIRCIVLSWDRDEHSLMRFFQLGHILKLSRNNVAAIYIATKRFSNFKSIDFSSTPEVLSLANYVLTTITAALFKYRWVLVES